MKNNDNLNRIRLLRIWEILQKDTDEDHPMGTETLREKLLEGGIDCHRTTLYEDIKLLNDSGYEILCRRGRSNQYYVMDRKFSNPEVHILMDAVQAASFITNRKTDVSGKIEAPSYRNVLSIYTSTDLKSFKFVKDIVNREYEDANDVGFQYPAFEIDENSIFIAIRAAFNNSDNYHDSNYILFNKTEIPE